MVRQPMDVCPLVARDHKHSYRLARVSSVLSKKITAQVSDAKGAQPRSAVSKTSLPCFMKRKRSDGIVRNVANNNKLSNH